MAAFKRRKEDPLQWSDPRCKMMKAAIYCRKSTATEGRSKSRDEQMEICQFDAERFGFGQVEVFFEAEGMKGEWYWSDTEGRHPGPYRPKFTDMVQGIEKGEIHTIIAYKQNRLVRDNGVEDALAKLCLKYGVRLIVGGRDIELDTARGRCNSAQDAARAREWRDQIEEDIKRDHDYKFRLGMFTRNPSCYGFRSKGRGTQAVQLIDEELANVRKIFEWFVGSNGEQRLGPHQIAQRCMDKGIITAVGARNHKVKNPGRVLSSQIKSILGNCMYVGEWQHNGDRKPYPQLLITPSEGEPHSAVPRELWDQAQALLAKGSPSMGRRAATSQRLLAGLVVCGSCGRPCHAKYARKTHGNKDWRWQCPRRMGRHRTCHGASFSSVKTDELDRWATEVLAPMVAVEMEAVHEEWNSSVERSTLAKLEADLAELKRGEVANLKVAMRVLDPRAFAELAASLQQERHQLELRVMELRRVVGRDDASQWSGITQDLWSSDFQKLKVALHRHLRWIALTDKGVIAYNQLGNYLAARCSDRDMSRFGTSENYRKIQPCDLDATIESMDWISDKSVFAAGRRQALGSAGKDARPEELVPDWIDPLPA